MKQYLIMCRSLTYAQRAERVLNRAGISAAVVKAPQSLLTGGCGYAISLHRNFDRAVLLLKNNGLLRGKMYKRENDGEYEEFIT